MVVTELETYFPHTLKSSYSHGLEAIYALETIDLKSVRRMAEEKPLKPAAVHVPEEILEKQLTFDLGSGFRSWIVPTLLSEPIQVLDLQKRLENALLDKNLTTLGELEQALPHLPATLGHGNIADIQQALTCYMAGKSKYKTQRIDFLSLIKCLYGDFDPKKAFVTLAPYGLGDWIVLTPLDKVDLKKAPLEVHLSWVQEIQKNVQSEKKQTLLKKEWLSLCQTWIKPWLLKREGFGTQSEIEAFLVLRSLDEEVAEQALYLLRNMIPYDIFLPCYQGVFAANQDKLKDLKHILDIKKTYYCSPYANYTEPELASLICQEMASHWSAVTLETIQKVLQF